MKGFGVGRALSAAIMAAVFIANSGAAAQEPPLAAPAPSPAPVTVSEDRASNMPSPSYRPLSRTEISGIRIESNGALITGPINARRTFIELDRPIIADAMQGHWARSVEVCAPRPANWKDGGARVAAENLMISEDLIDAKVPMRILQSFVPSPPHISLAMLQSGKKMMLRASQYKKAEEILVIVALPNGARNYTVLRVSPDRSSMVLQNGRSRETAVRCP